MKNYLNIIAKMKGNNISLMHKNVFEFGDQKVTQFVIFECKWLFSIILFYFHKSNGTQDRFHTHAFNALSLKLFGRYTEYTLEDDSVTSSIRKDVFKYFPRDCFHMIGNSTGCMTMLLSGPWKKFWLEYKDNEKILYNWNRKL